MFCSCCFFVLFFSVHQNYETTVLGNVWTDFHETFTKRWGGECSLKRRAAAWWKSCRRLANGECWWFAMRQLFSGTAERIFMKLSPNDGGDVVWNVVPPLGESRAAAWRMANVDDLLWDNCPRERLNGFSWNFHQTIGVGDVVWNVVPPLSESRAAAWRIANVDALRNLWYDSFAITRGRHEIYAMTLVESPEGATGGCVIQQWAGELM